MAHNQEVGLSDQVALAKGESVRVLVIGVMNCSLLGMAELIATGDRYQVGTAVTTDGASALRRVRGLKPDVLVADVFTKEALEPLRELLKGMQDHRCKTALVVVSHLVDPYFAREIVRGGNVSYVHKSSAVEDLRTAIDEAAEGRQFLSSNVALELVNLSLEEESEVLSPREREVLTLVARGHTNSEIAELLFLSVRTVEAYRASLHSKLGVHRRWELFQAAVERRLLNDFKVPAL